MEKKKLTSSSVVRGQWMVVVFSFNRGDHLANLMDSVRQLLPDDTRVTILDDDSDDTLTISTLDREQKVGTSVVRAVAWGSSGTEASNHGGLTANMQTALDTLPAQFLLFLQDDMQIVRSVDRDEMQGLFQFLRSDSPSAFLYVTFLARTPTRKESSPEREVQIKLTDSKHAFYTKTRGEGTRGFSDPVLLDAQRLRDDNWTFETEGRSADKAEKIYGAMPIWPHPFVAYLAWPPSLRNRRRSFAHRIWESFFVGFFPFCAMTEKESLEFRGRDLRRHPYASSFLKTVSPRARKPWGYGFTDAPRWIRALSKLESSLRTHLRSSAATLSMQSRRLPNSCQRVTVNRDNTDSG